MKETLGGREYLLLPAEIGNPVFQIPENTGSGGSFAFEQDGRTVVSVEWSGGDVVRVQSIYVVRCLFCSAF
jgi:hypothetical protein